MKWYGNLLAVTNSTARFFLKGQCDTWQRDSYAPHGEMADLLQVYSMDQLYFLYGRFLYGQFLYSLYSSKFIRFKIYKGQNL
jgi:hypothetical protein